MSIDDELHLKSFYIDSNVSEKVHHVLSNVCCVIVNDYENYCDYYIVSDKDQPFYQSTNNVHIEKYTKRANRIYSSSKSSQVDKCNLDLTTNIRSCLRKHNPSIIIITESKFIDLYGCLCDNAYCNGINNDCFTHKYNLSIMVTDKDKNYKFRMEHSVRSSICVLSFSKKKVRLQEYKTFIKNTVRLKDFILAETTGKVTFMIYF